MQQFSGVRRLQRCCPLAHLWSTLCLILSRWRRSMAQQTCSTASRAALGSMALDAGRLQRHRLHESRIWVVTTQRSTHARTWAISCTQVCGAQLGVALGCMCVCVCVFVPLALHTSVLPM